jgi:hypothetical protein
LLGAGNDVCSLGPHCESIVLKREPDAYRQSHHRFSEGSTTTTDDGPRPPWPAAQGRTDERPRRDLAHRDDPTLVDVFVDAMDRLDRINPPTG